MVDFGLSELLPLVQTIAIIAALLVTLYFSRRQIHALEADLETRVLNDLDEKFHRIGEIFLERPELVRSIYNTPGTIPIEVPLTYYVLFFCAHIFHMRQRRILRDNDWAGWLAWMKNAFRYGTLGRTWAEARMESWFDPEFREFVSRELLVLPAAEAPAPSSAAAPAAG
jgi:hypothetical protein